MNQCCNAQSIMPTQNFVCNDCAFQLNAIQPTLWKVTPGIRVSNTYISDYLDTTPHNPDLIKTTCKRLRSHIRLFASNTRDCCSIYVHHALYDRFCTCVPDINLENCKRMRCSQNCHPPLQQSCAWGFRVCVPHTIWHPSPNSISANHNSIISVTWFVPLSLSFLHGLGSIGYSKLRIPPQEQ